MAASILLPRNRSHVDAKFDLLFYSVMNYIQGDEFAGKAAFKSRGKENRLILLPVKAKGSKFRMCWWRMPSKRKSNKGENHETKRVVLVALTGYDRFLNPRRNDRLILIEFAILVADWFLEGDDVFSCSRKWNCLWKCHLSFLYFLGGGIFEDLIIDFLIVLIILNERIY